MIQKEIAVVLSQAGVLQDESPSSDSGRELVHTF